MMSSTRIFQKLYEAPDPASAVDAALIMPAADVGLKSIDSTHTRVESFSPDSAKEIPYGEEAGSWRKILFWLMPVFLLFGWVAFFKAASELSQAHRKSFELWVNAGTSFFAAAGATLVTIFLVTGLAQFAPYILAAVLGLTILKGLYHTAKHLSRALKCKNPADRYSELKKAGKSFLGIVINSLALALNLLVFQTAQLITAGFQNFAPDLFTLFMHYQELMALINGSVSTAITQIQGVSIAWASAFGLGLIIAAYKLNRQTLGMMRGRRKDEPTFERDAREDIMAILRIISSKHTHILKRFFFTLTAPVTLPLYAITSLIHFVIIRPLAVVLVGIPELTLRALWWITKQLGRCCLTCLKPKQTHQSGQAHKTQEQVQVVQQVQQQFPRQHQHPSQQQQPPPPPRSQKLPPGQAQFPGQPPYPTYWSNRSNQKNWILDSRDRAVNDQSRRPVVTTGRTYTKQFW